MTKAEFIDAVKKRRGVNLTRRQTEEVVNAVFDVLALTLRRHKRFTFPGFGRFAVTTRKARMGTDPRNQEAIRVPATRSVTFKPAPKLRGSL